MDDYAFWSSMQSYLLPTITQIPMMFKILLHFRDFSK